MGKPKKKKDFFVNPLKNKNIGWRSGKDLLAGKVIRVNEQGLENLEDYYSESDADFTQDLTANISRVTNNSKENQYKSITENPDTENEARPQNARSESGQSGFVGSSQSSNMFAWLKNKNIGRRTGKDVLAGKVITKNSHGFDNIEDYFSESSDAESMFFSKSRISVGLDNTDDVLEKSDSRLSASHISSAATDDQASYESSEDSCPTPRPDQQIVNVATPILEASEGEEDTPTNNVQVELSCGKDRTTSSHQKVKDQSSYSSKTQEVSSDDEEVQFKMTNNEETSKATAISEQTVDEAAVVDKTSEVTAITEQLTEVTAVTEKLTETIAVVDKTSEITDILGKSSKSYISHTINIGGNVTGSLTKSDDLSLESTATIPSFRTRKKLSFSALEKSLLMKEVQKKKRSTSEKSPAVNSNPFNKSGAKSTSSSLIEVKAKSTSSSLIEVKGDSGQLSAPGSLDQPSDLSVEESLDQPSDLSVEEEFRIVSDDSASKTTIAKRKSEGGVKLAVKITGSGKSPAQSGNSSKRRTSKSKVENTTDGESSLSEKVQTAKSVGKRKSQIKSIIPPEFGEESIETNSQNTSRTSKQISLKRKSDGEGLKTVENVQTAKSVGKRKSQIKLTVVAKDGEESFEESSQKSTKQPSRQISLKRKSDGEGLKTVENVQTAKSVGKQKSQIKLTVAAKDGEESIEESSQKSTKQPSKLKSLKRKSNAVVPSKTTDQECVKDKHNEESEDLDVKQTKPKKRKSTVIKKTVKAEGNLSRKVEYLYDSDDSSVIINEYEEEIEKEFNSRKSRSRKANAMAGKSVVGDQNLELNKIAYKKRRTFVLGDDDSEANEPLESIQMDVVKNRTASVSDTEGRESRRSRVTETEDVTAKKGGRKNKSSLEKNQGGNSCGVDIENVGNASDNIFDDDANKKKGSVVKKPLKRISRNSRKSCPQTSSIPTLPSNDTEDNGVGMKIRKNGRKSCPQSKAIPTRPSTDAEENVGKKIRKNGRKSCPQSKAMPTRPSKDMKDHGDDGNVMDTEESQDGVAADDEPCDDLPDGDEPCDDLPVRDISSDNLPDNTILEEKEEDAREIRRLRRAAAAKRKPDKKTKSSGLLKQTLSKNKTKKGITGKKKVIPDKSTDVVKSGKTDTKKASKAKGKIGKKQMVADKQDDVSKSKSKKVSKVKGGRKQKVSIGYVEEHSQTCTPKISTNSSTHSTTAKRRLVGINQKNNLQLNVSEEQEVDNMDIEVNISTVQSSRKKKLSSTENSLSNQKSNKQKSKKGKQDVSRENDDDEEEVSAVRDSDPVPANNDIPMLSLSKKSNLRRSLLVNTMQSPQGSCTPFSATPGSEFTLTRREEMLRSGVSFRQLKVERSGKKSTSQNGSRTSDNGDEGKGDIPDADQDVQDEVDYEDDNGDDIPQNDMGDDSRDVEDSSPGQQNTSTSGQPSGRKSIPSRGSGLLGLGVSLRSSPTNLTPCLVTPGRKSLSKGRRVTISHKVTEAVYDVPSDMSSSDTPVTTKDSRRTSIPGGDHTAYISMSSTPIHVYERTMSDTPEPFQKPEKCKIILPDPSPPDGVRRSQRTRVQTLEWHKNERVDYKYRKSGGFVVAGIIPSQEAKILELEKKKRKKLQKGQKRRKKRKNVESPPRNLSMHTEIPVDLNLTISDEIPVINPETEEEVYVECFASKDSGVFMGPSGKDPTPDDPFVMSRNLHQKGFGTGVLLLRPLQEKTIQMVSRGTLIFLLERGVITMTIHNASVIMQAGDSAFVPRGNTYSMENLRSEEAKLSYTVLKDTPDRSNIWN